VSNQMPTDSSSSKIEERFQTPQMVAAAADLSHSILEAVPDRLTTARGSLAAPSSSPSPSSRTRHGCWSPLPGSTTLDTPRSARHRLPSTRWRPSPSQHRLAADNLQPCRPPLRSAFRG
jgi:hypothetical protein